MSDQDSIWHQLLEEASHKTVILPEDSTLVVLGDHSAGKAHLVAALGAEKADINHGVGLSFNHLSVYSDDEDVLSRVHIWQLGDTEHAELLQYAIGKDSYHKTMALIALDMAKPWLLHKSLTKWLDILGIRCMEVLDELSSGKAEELRNRIKNGWEIDDLPVPDGALLHNFGIPIVVVLHKSDLLEDGIAQDSDFKEGHFEFIQQRLRLVCLEYGASLFFVSSKSDINIKTLHSYILHRLYDYPFSETAQVLDRCRVMVPSGWDTMAKIKVIFDGRQIAPDGLETLYEDVITDPRAKSVQVGETDGEIVAEDDQKFLQSHATAQHKLAQAKEPDGRQREIDSLVAGTKAASDRAAAAEAEARLALEQLEAKRAPHPATATGTAPTTAPASPVQPSVLENFFQSLLTRDGDARRKAEAELSRMRGNVDK